jgi:nitrate reductase NapD
MPMIISADMHMSYCEEELEKMKENIDFESTVKDLNTEKRAEEIDYFGSLKGKY